MVDSERPYWLRVLIGIDQLGNAIAGGDPDETISSRIGKRRFDSPAWMLAAKAINLFFFWQRNHVVESIEADEGEPG